jgi:hypothetical protein
VPANYKVNIDWSNNGTWTNLGEDVTRRVLPEINITYGRDQARALSPVANGSCGFDLDNVSRDYSPENSSSPLVGNILPARPVRIQAAPALLNGNPDFETTVSGWTGFGGSTVTRSSTFAYQGNYSGRLVSDAASDPRAEHSIVAVTPSITYQYAGFLYSPVGLGTQVNVGVNWFDSGFAYINTSQTNITLTSGVWNEVQTSVVSPSNAAWGAIKFGFTGTPGAGIILYGDNLQLTLDPVTLFRGHIDEYTVMPARGERKVNLSALDTLAKLNEAKSFTGLYPAIRTGDAIDAVLDSIGWPANARDIDTGATTLRWWIVNGDDAWSAIQEIMEAEGSPSLVTSDGNGNVIFKDRHHRLFTTLNVNPTFEGSTGSWTSFGGALTLETSISHNGQNSAKLVPDGVTAIVGIASEAVPAVAGTRYTVSGWLRCAVGRGVNLNVDWTNSSGAYISTSVFSITVVANTWTFFYTEYTSPALTGFGTIRPTMSGTPAGSNILYCDDVRIRSATASVATFRDATTEPKFSEPLSYDHGWRDVVNSVQFSVDERPR